MGEVGEYCKICGGAHPTGACQEIIKSGEEWKYLVPKEKEELKEKIEESKTKLETESSKIEFGQRIEVGRERASESEKVIEEIWNKAGIVLELPLPYDAVKKFDQRHEEEIKSKKICSRPSGYLPTGEISINCRRHPYYDYLYFNSEKGQDYFRRILNLADASEEWFKFLKEGDELKSTTSRAEIIGIPLLERKRVLSKPGRKGGLFRKEIPPEYKTVTEKVKMGEFVDNPEEQEKDAYMISFYTRLKSSLYERDSFHMTLVVDKELFDKIKSEIEKDPAFIEKFYKTKFPEIAEAMSFRPVEKVELAFFDDPENLQKKSFKLLFPEKKAEDLAEKPKEEKFTEEFYKRHGIEKSEANIRDYIVKDIKGIMGALGFKREKGEKEEEKFLFRDLLSFRNLSGCKFEVTLTENLEIIISDPDVTYELEEISEEGRERIIKQIEYIRKQLKKLGILIPLIIKMGDRIFTEIPEKPTPPPEAPEGEPPAYLERPWYFTLERGSKLYDTQTGKTLIYTGYQEHYYYLYDPETKELIKFFEEDFSRAKDRFEVSRPEDLGAYLNRLKEEFRKEAESTIESTVERARYLNE